MHARGPSEYVVFRQNDHVVKEIDCETYEKIHPILINNRLPQALHNISPHTTNQLLSEGRYVSTLI
jgi:hypothetical protein